MYKIAIIGPESTGKTMLAEQLAAHYHSPWVPEYARMYIESLSRPYHFDDIKHIALKQIEQEIEYETDRTYPFVFFDTELIITKVWFEYCYNEVPSFVEDRLNTGFFDLYLLCEPDIPWVADPVREHGHDREHFFNLYQSEIVKLKKPYVCIHGIDEDRVQNAIRKINDFFKLTNSEFVN